MMLSIKQLAQWIRANRLTCFLAGTALLAGIDAARVTHQHNWLPVDVPIAYRNSVATSFRSDLKGQYIVQIDMERNVPVETLFGYRPPKATLNVVDEEGTRVDRKYDGGYWGQTFGRELVSFEAVPGKTYQVTWKPLKKDALFDKLAPRLQVRVSRMVSRDISMRVTLLAFLSLVFFVTTILRVMEKQSQNRRRAEQRF